MLPYQGIDAGMQHRRDDIACCVANRIEDVHPKHVLQILQSL